MSVLMKKSTAIITDEMVDSYQRDGFVKACNILSKSEAQRYGKRCLEIAQANEGNDKDMKAFTQLVNNWRTDAIMRELVFHPNVIAAAKKLARTPLRLWHDHILVKKPHNQAATEFHQDQPYWPHSGGPNSISIWIALNNVPPERGCMSFIPRSHKHRNIPVHSLNDRRSLFTLCPELEWEPRVTSPLQAGDCTFHHGRTAHFAHANSTDEHRLAIAIIFMDDGTEYTGSKHIVTNSMDLMPGDKLDGEQFPLI